MSHGRKITGGKYHKQKKKKRYEKPSQETQTTIGETKRKNLRIRGGNIKTITLKTNIVNLKAKEKTQKAEMKNVASTPQNVFLARQNRLSKGAIIETSLGKARITNRPSKEGHVNAVLIEE